MRNLEYQVEKKSRSEIDPKTVILKKYHDLLYVFSKQNSNTLLLHQKYNHKVILEEELKYNHILLYKILSQELNIVKYYLVFYLTKGFIETNLSLYFILVFFVTKPC